jgi:Family of unknown function (DUF5317)
VTVLAVTAIGVATALWSPRRILRMAELRLGHVWLVWCAFLTQIVVFQWLAEHLPVWAVETIHFATYALVVLFIVVNRHLPGSLVIAAGTACNLLAITINGGTMPADMGAWERAGLDPIPVDVFNNSTALSDPTLLFLGDVFAIPAGWPLANVFSIGDVLIVVGGTYLAHRWCAGRREEARQDDLVLTAA